MSENTRSVPLHFDISLLTVYDFNNTRGDIFEEVKNNANLALNALFKKMTEGTYNDAEKGCLKLPLPVLCLPRSKHVPLPKPKTKWEKFAEAKGIQKRKRSAKDYNEATGEWLPRYGGKSVKNRNISEDWVEELK